jgi:anti-sigma B factor antagonist
MEVVTTQLKRCDLVKTSGSIDSDSAPQLARAFQDITNAGRFKIVFDMSEVDYISSAGLRVMIKAQRTCQQWDRGEMVLAGVSERLYRTLDLVGYTRFFKLYQDAAIAVGSF